MTKQNWVKIALIFSLIFNVVLTTGFGIYKHYARQAGFQMAALSARAEAKMLEHILSELNTTDATKIENLKDSLQKHIENAKKNATVWEDAYR